MTSQPVVSRFRCAKPDPRPSLWAGVGRRFLFPLSLSAGVLLVGSPVLSAVPKVLWVALDGREILSCNLLDAIPGPLYRRRYPALGDLDPHYRAGQGVPPDNNVLRGNISLGGRWLHVGWHATEFMLELKDNLMDEDPGFTDVSQLDLRLKWGASARNLGFKTIPIEKIGLYPGTARRELERSFP